MAKKKHVSVDVRSSVIQVSGALYPIEKITGIRCVTVKPSGWIRRLFTKTKYAVLVKLIGEEYFVLVVTRDESALNGLFIKIRDAIDAQSSGNHTYFSEVTLQGDMVNQSGNFSVGYNSGEIKM